MVRPVAVLQCREVRLRPLTEAECYARCYGGVRTERVSVLRLRTDEGTDASSLPDEPKQERLLAAEERAA